MSQKLPTVNEEIAAMSEELPVEGRITNKAGRGDKPRYIRPVERQRMRPWLISHLDNNDIPGLVWQTKHEKVFKISWKHAANQCFNMQKDTNLFERWAIHTGRHQDSDHKRWKANFRCALNSLPDVVEHKEQGIKKGNNAFKVYRFLDEKETKMNKELKGRRKKEPPDFDGEEEGGTLDHSYAESDLVDEVMLDIPRLEQLFHSTGLRLKGTDLREKLRPLQGHMDDPNLQDILAAATASLAAGSSSVNLEKISIEQLSRLGEMSKMKLDISDELKAPDSSQHNAFFCSWCEKVFPSKIEIFKHFLISHQNRLVSRKSYKRPAGTAPDPGDPKYQKLQQEIEDLEKEVFNFASDTFQSAADDVENEEVVTLTSEPLAENQALDLSVKDKGNQSVKEEVALDLSMSGSKKNKPSKIIQGKFGSKRRRSSLEIDYTVKFGNYGLAGAPRTKRQMSLHKHKKEQEEEKLAKKMATTDNTESSSQRSVEDLVHAEILMSLQTSAADDAENSGDGSVTSNKGKKEASKVKKVKGGPKKRLQNIDKVIDEVAKGGGEKVNKPSPESEKSIEKNKEKEKEKEIEKEKKTETKMRFKAFRCGLCMKKFDDPRVLNTHVEEHKKAEKASPIVKLKPDPVILSETNDLVYYRQITPGNVQTVWKCQIASSSGACNVYVCGICKAKFYSLPEVAEHEKLHSQQNTDPNDNTATADTDDPVITIETVEGDNIKHETGQSVKIKSVEGTLQHIASFVNEGAKNIQSIKFDSEVKEDIEDVELKTDSISDKDLKDDKKKTAEIESCDSESIEQDKDEIVIEEKKENNNESEIETTEKIIIETVKNDKEAAETVQSESQTNETNQLEDQANETVKIVIRTIETAQNDPEDTRTAQSELRSNETVKIVLHTIETAQNDPEDSSELHADETIHSELKTTETIQSEPHASGTFQNEPHKDETVQSEPHTDETVQKDQFQLDVIQTSDIVKLDDVDGENNEKNVEEIDQSDKNCDDEGTENVKEKMDIDEPAGIVQDKQHGDNDKHQEDIVDGSYETKATDQKDGINKIVQCNVPAFLEVSTSAEGYRIKKEAKGLSISDKKVAGLQTVNCGICSIRIEKCDIKAHLESHDSKAEKELFEDCIICRKMIARSEMNGHLKAHSVIELSLAEKIKVHHQLQLQAKKKMEANKQVEYKSPIDMFKMFVCNLCNLGFEDCNALADHVEQHLKPDEKTKPTKPEQERGFKRKTAVFVMPEKDVNAKKAKLAENDTEEKEEKIQENSVTVPTVKKVPIIETDPKKNSLLAAALSSAPKYKVGLPPRTYVVSKGGAVAEGPITVISEDKQISIGNLQSVINEPHMSSERTAVSSLTLTSSSSASTGSLKSVDLSNVCTDTATLRDTLCLKFPLVLLKPGNENGSDNGKSETKEQSVLKKNTVSVPVVLVRQENQELKLLPMSSVLKIPPASKTSDTANTAITLASPSLTTTTTTTVGVVPSTMAGVHAAGASVLAGALNTPGGQKLGVIPGVTILSNLVEGQSLGTASTKSGAANFGGRQSFDAAAASAITGAATISGSQRLEVAPESGISSVASSSVIAAALNAAAMINTGTTKVLKASTESLNTPASIAKPPILYAPLPSGVKTTSTTLSTTPVPMGLYANNSTLKAAGVLKDLPSNITKIVQTEVVKPMLKETQKTESQNIITRLLDAKGKLTRQTSQTVSMNVAPSANGSAIPTSGSVIHTGSSLGGSAIQTGGSALHIGGSALQTGGSVLHTGSSVLQAGGSVLDTGSSVLQASSSVGGSVLHTGGSIVHTGSSVGSSVIHTGGSVTSIQNALAEAANIAGIKTQTQVLAPGTISPETAASLLGINSQTSIPTFGALKPGELGSAMQLNTNAPAILVYKKSDKSSLTNLSEYMLTSKQAPVLAAGLSAGNIVSSTAASKLGRPPIHGNRAMVLQNQTGVMTTAVNVSTPTLTTTAPIKILMTPQLSQPGAVVNLTNLTKPAVAAQVGSYAGATATTSVAMTTQPGSIQLQPHLVNMMLSQLILSQTGQAMSSPLVTPSAAPTASVTGPKPTFNLVFAPQQQATPIKTTTSTSASTKSAVTSLLPMATTGTNVTGPQQSLILMCKGCNQSLDSIHLMGSHVCPKTTVTQSKSPISVQFLQTSLPQPSQSVQQQPTYLPQPQPSKLVDLQPHTKLTNQSCSKCQEYFKHSKYAKHIKQHNMRLEGGPTGNTQLRSGRENNRTEFYCSLCKIYLPDLVSYNLHHTGHSNQKIKCPYCPSELFGKTRYDLHLAFEHPWHCNKCEHRFTKLEEVWTHASLDFELNPSLKCRICNRYYPSIKSFETHVSIDHAEETGVTCIKQVTVSTYLQRAKMETECTCSCPTCDIGFYDKEAMIKHVQAAHFTATILTCGLCDGTTPLPFYYSLDNHKHFMGIKLDNIMLCHHCSQLFPHDKEFVQHLTVHNVHVTDSIRSKLKSVLKDKACTSEMESLKSDQEQERMQTAVSKMMENGKESESVQVENAFEIQRHFQPEHARATETESVDIIKHLQSAEELPETKKGDIDGNVINTVAENQDNVEAKTCDLNTDITVRTSASDMDMIRDAFRCKECMMGPFKTKYLLKQHTVIKHLYPRNRPSTSYFQHMVENLRHTKRFDCGMCDRKFESQLNLLRHQFWHRTRKTQKTRTVNINPVNTNKANTAATDTTTNESKLKGIGSASKSNLETMDTSVKVMVEMESNENNKEGLTVHNIDTYNDKDIDSADISHTIGIHSAVTTHNIDINCGVTTENKDFDSAVATDDKNIGSADITHNIGIDCAVTTHNTDSIVTTNNEDIDHTVMGTVSPELSSERSLESSDLSDVKTGEENQYVNVYHCKLCQRDCENMSRLKEHLLENHKDLLLKCAKCEMYFMSEQDLIEHKCTEHDHDINVPHEEIVSEKCESLLSKCENVSVKSDNDLEKCENVSGKCEFISEKCETVSEKCENVLAVEMTPQTMEFDGQSIIESSAGASAERIDNDTGKISAVICNQCKDIVYYKDDGLSEAIINHGCQQT